MNDIEKNSLSIKKDESLATPPPSWRAHPALLKLAPAGRGIGGGLSLVLLSWLMNIVFRWPEVAASGLHPVALKTILFLAYVVSGLGWFITTLAAGLGVITLLGLLLREILEARAVLGSTRKAPVAEPPGYRPPVYYGWSGQSVTAATAADKEEGPADHQEERESLYH